VLNADIQGQNKQSYAEKILKAKPIADQYVEDNAIPPAFVEIWQHMTKSELQCIYITLGI
jgi:hypothetical protein